MKKNGKTESIYHSQGDPFDVLFVLDHCGKLGLSVNRCNTKRMKINPNYILDSFSNMVYSCTVL